MKTKILVFVLLVFTTIKTNAQWEPDFRLTNDPGNSLTSFNNAFTVASNGDFVHVVWFDDRDPGFGIYYKRSSDGGVNFGTDTRLTPISVISSYNPSIATSGSDVHVVWHDYRDGNESEIYYKQSADGGETWGADTRLTNDPDNSQNPSMIVSGSDVHVVWTDTRDGDYEIYYKRSTDGGLSWGPDTNLTNNSSTQSGACVSISGSILHVAWVDNRDFNNEIYYKRSTDAGTSWEVDKRLTNDVFFTSGPSLSVSGLDVNVVWHDQRDGNNEIYFKHSADAGVNWGTDTRITNDAAQSLDPFAAVSGSEAHVVWWDDRDGNFEIYYKHSSDGGASWGTDTRLTNDPAGSHAPFVSISGSVLHVVWADQRDFGNNNEIYHKRNATGNLAGIDELSKDLLFTIVPNPSNDKFTIKVNAAVKNARIEIFSAKGESIYSENLSNEIHTINCQSFANGIYFVKANTREKQHTQKLILVHD